MHSARRRLAVLFEGDRGAFGRTCFIHERHVAADAVGLATVGPVFFPLFEQGLQHEIGPAVELAIPVLVVFDRVAIPAQLLGLAERARGFTLVERVADGVVERAEVLVAGPQAILKA